MAFTGRLQESAYRDIVPFQSQLANISQREVPNVVDELREHVYASHDGLDMGRAGFVHPVAQCLHGAANHSQGSSQLVRNVREKLAARLLVALQRLRHLIERARQGADVIVSLNTGTLREIAFGNGLGGFAQGANRPRDLAREIYGHRHCRGRSSQQGQDQRNADFPQEAVLRKSELS